MPGESLAYLTHATFCPGHRRRRPGRVTLDSILRTKKESWPSTFTNLGICIPRSVTCLAKMPLLQLPNCQRSFAAEAAHSVTCYRDYPSNNSRLPYQWTEADKAVNPSWNGLPYQPLATRVAYRR